MRVFTALVWYEIRERKALLAAAAVASLLPLLAPILPGTGSNPATDIREAVMWVMVLCLVPLFALLLGVGFMGRDLSEGRLGFYYAQPVSGATLWFGKLAAVVLLVWAVQLIIMLPTVILSPDPATILSGKALLDVLTVDWMPTAVVWGATMAIILLAHAIGLVWRARSVWIVVDLIALMLVAGGAWAAFEPFGFMVAPRISSWIVGSVATALFVGLVLGGAAQVIGGRVDLRRCHVVLTSTLWTVLSVTVAGLLGWTCWIRSATLEDLDRFHSAVMGSGDWVAVVGVSGGRLDYLPRFLLNPIDGRCLPIGPEVDWNHREIGLSEDGCRAVWVDYEGIDDWLVMWANLEEDRPEARFTGVTLGFEWEDLAVSPRGSRMAVLEDRTISVYDVDSGQQVAATTVGGASDPFAIQFNDEHLVRFLASTRFVDNQGDRTYGIGDFDVEARTLGEIVEIDSFWRWWSHRLHTSDGAGLAQRERPDGNRLVLEDPDSQETIADLGKAPDWSDVRILDDGRIVILRDRNLSNERDTENRVEVFSPDGSLLHRIDLPLTGDMTDGGLASPDRILIGVRDWREARERGGPERGTAVIDLTAGRVEETFEGVIPVLGRFGSASTAGAWAAGSLAGRLFLDDESSLLLWDPTDGSFETVIPVPE